MRLLFFDIETTGLDPTKSKILCIGYSDGIKTRVIDAMQESEIDAILRFLDLLQVDSVLVGYNIKGFDIPFITTRALINSIKTKYVYRVHRSCKIDLMRVVKNYLYTGKMKHDLKTICDVVGVDVENDDINGCAVPLCDDEEKIIEHCRRDVERVVKLYEDLEPLCRLYFYRKYEFDPILERGWMEE